MSVLRTIESKIEGLFEGVFGRAFRTHVQPIELARKLVKEMDDHRTVSVSRVYVPNEYTVYLSPQDRKQFGGYEESLVGELQEYLAEHARRERYALLTAPTVLVMTDEDLAVGEFGIATRLVQAEAASAEDDDAPPFELPVEAPAQTMVYRPPAVAAAIEVEAPPPPPEREVVTLTVAGEKHEITSSRVVLGRSRACDVHVPDVNVSRRHAEVRQEGTTYWVVDLDSTNGTVLNGKAVERERLRDGDTITLGSTEIVFGRSVP
jgi:Protein of unknown function (DUF3662)/FHA domain